MSRDTDWAHNPGIRVVGDVLLEDGLGGRAGDVWAVANPQDHPQQWRGHGWWHPTTLEHTEPEPAPAASSVRWMPGRMVTGSQLRAACHATQGAVWDARRAAMVLDASAVREGDIVELTTGRVVMATDVRWGQPRAGERSPQVQITTHEGQLAHIPARVAVLGRRWSALSLAEQASADSGMAVRSPTREKVLEASNRGMTATVRTASGGFNAVRLTPAREGDGAVMVESGSMTRRLAAEEIVDAVVVPQEQVSLAFRDIRALSLDPDTLGRDAPVEPVTQSAAQQVRMLSREPDRLPRPSDPPSAEMFGQGPAAGAGPNAV